MNDKLLSLKTQLDSELSEVKTLSELDAIRVNYLGKKGCITDLLKNMKDLSPEEKKTFGQEVNTLKNLASESINRIIKEEVLYDQNINKTPAYPVGFIACALLLAAGDICRSGSGFHSADDR